MTTFTTNLKQYRMAKGLTQEQAAEALGVSTQTVSRWECGTTLPDAVILPRIAELYCVTIDDLYRERTVAYANYAARLGSVFEASHRPEDFIRADTEYRKLLKSGAFTSEDLRLYGILNQYMMEVCRDRAEELFRRVLTAGPGDNPETYWSVQRQLGYFLWELGRIGEVVETFLPLVEGGSGELQEWICLIQALFFAKDYDTALHRAEQAEGRFPESAILHIYMGDLLQALGRSDEAFPTGKGRWRWSRNGVTRPIPWQPVMRSAGSTKRPAGSTAASRRICRPGASIWRPISPE